MLAPSTTKLRLAPYLVRTVGFMPIFSCCRRGLIGPIDALPAVVWRQAALLQVQKAAAITLCGGQWWRGAGREDGLLWGAVGRPGVAPANWRRIEMLGEKQGHGIPQSPPDVPLTHRHKIHYKDNFLGKSSD